VLFNGFLLPKKTKLIIWEHFSLKSNYGKFIFKVSRFYAILKAYKFVLLSKQEIIDWELKMKLPNSKVSLIQNPVSINQPMQPKNKFNLRKVVAIGNNAKVKGFDILINAWRNIDTDWELDIIGLDESENDLLVNELDIKDNEKINLKGKVKNMEGVYANTSIFVLSSRKEAVPLVLIESQCFCLPAVVFSHLTSALDIVQDSALIADYNEPINSLANSLQLLIEDEKLYQSLYEKTLLNRTAFSQTTFFEKWDKLLVND
jgi:glycosyltransferase involved in cell wall biosynthesis